MSDQDNSGLCRCWIRDIGVGPPGHPAWAEQPKGAAWLYPAHARHRRLWVIFIYAVNVAAPESIGSTPEPSGRAGPFPRLMIREVVL